VYFVDPTIICTTGRTQEQYDVDGTGTDILFQNGLTYSDPANLIKAPQTEDEIVAEVTLSSYNAKFIFNGIDFFLLLGCVVQTFLLLEHGQPLLPVRL